MHRYFHRLLLLLVALGSFGFAQVAYQLSPVAHQQFFDANGFPLSGGFVYTYTSGSVTPLVTYKDNAGTANTNPIVLDAGGYATIYLGQSSYKFCVQNSSAVQQYCQDNIQNFQQVILSSANTWSANNFWTSGHLLEGTLLGFSAAGVTTADAGISRTAANTLACGNGTQGDVSCTLKLAKLNNGADLSLPTSADTLVGRVTTDTLTNKTLTNPTVTEGSCLAGSVSNDIFCGETADHLLHYNPNNAGLQQVPFVSMTTSNYTNATTTFSSLTFSPPLPTIAASRNYSLRCELAFQGSAGTAGPKFQITGPAGVSGLVLSVDGATNATAYSSSVVMGFSTPNTALGTLGATATDFIAHVVIGIRNGINSGAIALQAAANGAGTLTIEASSFCVLQ